MSKNVLPLVNCDFETVEFPISSFLKEILNLYYFPLNYYNIPTTKLKTHSQT